MTGFRSVGWRELVAIGLMATALPFNAVAFPLVRDGHTATLVVGADDAKVVHLAAADFATDIHQVTGTPAAIAATLPSDPSLPVVVIGTLGHSPALDALVTAGRLDVSALHGKWETFLLATIDDTEGSPPTFVIAGSDRRGTAFGVYEVSQMIGVSPWHWWADVTPRHRDDLILPDGLRHFGPPSVKYRGIFINDEDWGLEPWAAHKFEPEHGSIGPKTYAKVFELLLRLKANTLWPAMHACTKAFNADPRNAALADAYAIVMGSSHAEPMLRNNVREWTGPHQDYNYVTNREGVRAYWEERARTNGRYENIYTIGMRGIHDSAIQGTTNDAQRIQILEQVFADQRALLAQYAHPPGASSVGAVAPNRPPSDVTAVPQVFCAYKEVLDLYRQGLQVPPDVTIMWPDDNFGYVRNFADAKERQRPGGFGIYYHLSYLGRPLAYLWLGTTPPALVWEEMTRAYAYGADRIWIANVGDIKPTEPGMEFFLDLAWDIHRWGPDGQPAFLRTWAAREFGSEPAEAIAGIMGDYYRLNFQRRPEHLQWWLPKQPPHRSPLTLAEADARLAAFADLRQRADQVAAALPADRQDAFEELVGYPVRGSALANQRYFLGERGDERGAHAADAELNATTRHFNDDLAEGKWQGIVNLEPADHQWASMRIAPWAPPAFAQSPKPSTGPGRILAILNGGDFTARYDHDGRSWQRIIGLGRSGNAITLAPATPPKDESASDTATWPSVDYATELPAGEVWIHLELLPTHPVNPELGTRVAVSIDGQPAVVLTLSNDDGSPAWAQGVLNEMRVLTTSFKIDHPGPHHLRLSAHDPGIVIDRIAFTSDPNTPFLWPGLVK